MRRQFVTQERDEEALTQSIAREVEPRGFKLLDPVPAVDDVRMIAAWRRKNWNTNRGIAIVAMESTTGNPGEFARQLRRPIGRKIGYVPFLYEMGLHVVVTGAGVLPRASDLHNYVDKLNNQFVLLQSVHVVDLAAADFLAGLPAEVQTLEEEIKPGVQKAFEAVNRLRNPLFYATYDYMKVRFDCSRQDGWAAKSARSWAMRLSGPDIDAIETGISRFLRGD
jgi:hypothetical protein